MKRFTKFAALPLAASMSLVLSACGGGGGSTVTPPPAKTTPTVSVTPSASSITTAQSLSVPITVSGSSGTPTGTVTLSSGSYTSAATTLSGGSATINIAAGTLAAGSDTLSATYTPDTSSSSTYNSASGSGSVTVTAPNKTTPTVTVAPASSNITTAQSLSVTLSVSGGSGTPTGTVTLTSGSYTSTAAPLSSGSATINIAVGALAAGNDTLSATYTPDASSSSTYNSASGSGSVTVTAPNKTTPSVTVAPVSSSITVAQSLSVTLSVSGSSGTPTGTVILSSGSYTSTATTLSSGSVTINIAAGVLAVGSDTLLATYTPDANSSSTYNNASGSGPVTVTALATPTMTVTPSSSAISTTQSLSVTVLVSGSTSGYPTPSGSVKLTSGSYTSSAVTLSGGSGTINVPAGALALGTDTLTVTYTPDSSGSVYYNSNSKTGSVTVGTLLVPTVTVTPSAPIVASEPTITVAQSLSVTVSVSGGTGNPTPTGSISLSSGSYTSSAAILNGGSATIVIPAGQLATSTDTLAAVYTPDAASSGIYNTSTGNGSVAVDPLIIPNVTVSPDFTAVTTAQSLSVTVTVSGSLGTPTGSVKLSGVGYNTTASATLSAGSATIVIPAGALAVGSDALTAKYTPDAASAVIYNTLGQGSSPAITVTLMTMVAVNQSPTSVKVSNQLLGMNMAAWYDPTISAILPAFQSAGIKALRWPGGSWSDDYHWATNTMCGNYPNSNATFANFLNDLAIPGSFDVALTANYGTNSACNGPGQPSEAAAWVTAALNNSTPVTVSHMTVGNEVYGSWETDMHSTQHDPTTYAAAVAGATGYYQSIRTASPNTLVGVDVEATQAWDSIVLANAPYDFVEYHFYPQNPGQENDSNLISQYPQLFTTNINTIKSELATLGKPNTPIFVGEIGSVSSKPGKQTWSITQGLYAGQVLGEAMNDGISHLTWWIGFGNCNGSGGNNAASLYGWQTFGAYNIFSDGPSDGTCPDAGPIGTMSPTAVAFQLFSQVAVNGEYVLTATSAGDTADVRAYAATHKNGTQTVLLLFNLSETISEPVTVTLSNETNSSPNVTITTYNKALYDETNAATPVWAAPTVKDLGAQPLPLTLTLTPWSMNLLVIQ